MRDLLLLACTCSLLSYTAVQDSELEETVFLSDFDFGICVREDSLKATKFLKYKLLFTVYPNHVVVFLCLTTPVTVISFLLTTNMYLLHFMGLLLMPSMGICQTYYDAKNLKNSLFANYDRSIRPVTDQKKAIDYSYAFFLTALLEVDEINQVIALQGFNVNEWTDELLTWNQSEHNNVSELNPPSDSFWYPAFNVDDSVTGLQALLDPDDISLALLQSSGKMTWQPLVQIKSYCKLLMTKFPYDSHTCIFNFYPSRYTQKELNLTTLTTDNLLAYYTAHGEWEVLSVSMEANTVKYFGLSTAYSRVQYTLSFRRRPSFFVLNLLFPTCALSFMNILVFILPADSGEKTGYSITVLLSVMLFMGTTSNVLPPTSDVVPLITQYLTWLTIISILSVAASIITILVHHSKNENERKKNIIYSVLRTFKAKIAKNTSKPSNVETLSRNITIWQRKATSFPDEHLGYEMAFERGKHYGQTGKTLKSFTESRDVQNGSKAYFNSGSMDANGNKNLHPNASTVSTTGLTSCQAPEKGERRDQDRPKPMTETRTEFWSSNLDTIFFIVFLAVWTTVTVTYMTCLFS